MKLYQSGWIRRPRRIVLCICDVIGDEVDKAEKWKEHTE